MWYLIYTMLLSIVVMIMVLRFEGKRKRMLADRIPGPNGSFLIGMLPSLLQGPEKLISKMLAVYRT